MNPNQDPRQVAYYTSRVVNNTLELTNFGSMPIAVDTHTFAQALPHCHNLRRLVLYNNFLNRAQVREIIRAFPQCPSLTSIFFQNNFFGEENVKELINVLPSTQISHISLLFCTIDIAAARRLAIFVSGNPQFKQLSIEPDAALSLEVRDILQHPLHHVTAGLMLLKTPRGQRPYELTQDHRELILRLVEPWVGRYRRDKPSVVHLA